MKLIQDSGEIFIGGENDINEKYIAPTILRNVAPDSPVMSEEIFGPVLPVLKIKNVNEAIDFINNRPKSLAVYLFSNDSSTQQQVLAQTSSGGILINHTALQFAVPSLPFGGIGASGMGAYHAKATFETFSHRKSVLIKPTILDPSFTYPPYTKRKESWIRRFL